MSARFSTYLALAGGVGMPAQAAAVNSLTDWRDWIKDYNTAIAAITATVIALWWTVKLIRLAHDSYFAIFVRPPQGGGGRTPSDEADE